MSRPNKKTEMQKDNPEPSTSSSSNRTPHRFTVEQARAAIPFVPSARIRPNDGGARFSSSNMHLQSSGRTSEFRSPTIQFPAENAEGNRSLESLSPMPIDTSSGPDPRHVLFEVPPADSLNVLQGNPFEIIGFPNPHFGGNIDASFLPTNASLSYIGSRRMVHDNEINASATQPNFSQQEQMSTSFFRSGNSVVGRSRGVPSARPSIDRPINFGTLGVGLQNILPVQSDGFQDQITMNRNPYVVTQTASGPSSSTQATFADNMEPEGVGRARLSGLSRLMNRLNISQPHPSHGVQSRTQSSNPRLTGASHSAYVTELENRLANASLESDSNTLALQRMLRSSSSEVFTPNSTAAGSSGLHGQSGKGKQILLGKHSNTQARQTGYLGVPSQETEFPPRWNVRVKPLEPTNNALEFVKWDGILEHPTSPHKRGVDCGLCQRDLYFTPTGTLPQPGSYPQVAVLPCGHAFHDHCLKIITPSEQSKDPPCVVCMQSSS